MGSVFVFAIAALCISIVFLIIGRIAYVVWTIQRKRASFQLRTADEQQQQQQKQQRNVLECNTPQSKPLKTLVVLGSGGHTSEMIQLIQNLPSKYYQPLVFVKAETDTTSVGRLQAAQLLLPSSSSSASSSSSSTSFSIQVYDIPRAREVGQSYLSSVFSTLRAFIFAVQLMRRLQPDLLLCNGPGTCLPLCVAAFGWRVVGISNQTRIVFVESFCRVQTMSLTGRLLYAWVDLFVVHWPFLQTKYPLTNCISTLIRHEHKKDQ